MYNAARAILAARMATWTTTPIHWPNTPPLTVTASAWVRFAVISNGDAAAWITSGHPGFESGFVAAQVFVPSGSGDGTASALADSVAALFREYTSGQLSCGPATVRTVGDADGWYQINISVPWTISG